MTPAEITAEVMALSKQQVDRACAEEIMGWAYTPERRAPNGELTTVAGWRRSDDASYRGRTFTERGWRPTECRNQSRAVTVRVIEQVGGVDYLLAFGAALKTCLLSGDYFTLDGEVQMLRVLQASPLDESRAALIAHRLHKEQAK